MEIKFDYRFDTNDFFTEERKAALNLAGDVWSILLQDDFAPVPVGAEFTVQNPQTGANETIVLQEAIDDLVIFVGASSEPFSGIPVGNAVSETGNLSSLAQAQYDGIDLQGDIFQRRISSDFRNGGAVTDFEPWVGTISFATNPDPAWDFSLREPDLDKFDFVSIALHEIGHILGVGTAPIFDVLGAGGAFDGVNAKEVSDGNPIPLEASLGHIDEGFRDNKVLLDSILEPGRQSPTEIDLALLADIGYEIAGFTKQGELPELATAEGEFIIGAAVNQMIAGLAGDDEIRGNISNDTLLGDEGNDTLFGFAEADELSGGIGDDVLNGNEQNDTLLGDEGNDTLFGEDDNDVLFGGLGTDRLQGDAGNDTLRGEDGNDTLLGGENNDLIVGNSGEDRLQGDVGNDILRGGDGNDTLLGEAGDDTLEGGMGDDSLEGAAGSDRFEVGYDGGSDRINDFTVGEDAIVVSAKYDWNTNTYDLNDPSEILDAITDTGEVGDSSDSFTQITLRDNTITVVHNEALTTEDFAIYFSFQPQLTTTSNGFVINLSQDINLDRLNLYRGIDSNAGISDLRLVRESTGETIAGSLVANDNTLTFVKTDGILAPDDYTLTLFSRGNGFISSSGELLDGDFDGIAGDNFVTQFTVEEREQRVLSLDDFSLGIEPINSPLGNDNITVSLNDGAEVTTVDFTLTYDAELLTIEDIILNEAIGEDWTITTEELTNPGTAIVSLTGTTPLDSGKIDLVELQAIAPETATNGASGIVTLEDVSLNNGELTAIADSAYQKIAYLGDTDNDLNYTETDVYNISLLATGISDGLTAFDLTNPQIIADINDDGVISAFDSYLVTQLEIS